MLDIISKTTKIIDLGNLEDLKVFFYDDIIPNVKRDNDNIMATGYWLNLNGIRYYFKPFTSSIKMLHELLGEKVSIYFDIETVHYEIARGYILKGGNRKEYYGLISKWARIGEVKYYSLFDLKEEIKPYYDYSPFKGIFNYLEQKYPGQLINESFRKFIVRDLFSGDWDRLANEIIIKNDEGVIDLSYLCDYEDEFRSVIKQLWLPGFYRFSLYDDEVLNFFKEDEYFSKYLKKALQINLEALSIEIMKEKQIRLLPYDKYTINNYENEMKRVLKNRLNI